MFAPREISGVVSQGTDWKNAEGNGGLLRYAKFGTAKLCCARKTTKNHELEVFTGVEMMLRHLGSHFQWKTDHKGLIHLIHGNSLTERQARWMDKISEHFEMIHVPVVENVLANCSSRIYSNDVLCSFTQHIENLKPQQLRVTSRHVC